MATPGANNNDQLREARDLLQQLNTLKRQLGEEPLNLGEDALLRIAQDLPNDIRRARKELEDIQGSASDLYSRLRGVTSEFKYQATTLGKVRGAFRQLEEAAQNLKHDEQGISDLNTSQLKKLQEKVKKSKELVRQEADSLLNNNILARHLEQQVQQKIQAGKSEEEINAYILNRLGNIQTLSSEEKALLQLHFDQRDAVTEINNKILQRIEQEKKVNKLLGVGGAVVGGISSLMGKLGMNSGIFSNAVSEAEEAMRETAKNIEAGTQSGGKLTVLMAGLKPLAKGFASALLDPLTVITAILDGFFRVNKATVGVQRLTGQYETSIAGVNDRLATSTQFLETAAELTKQLGVSATLVFAPDQIAQLAEAKNLLGLSAEQAGRMGILMKTTGKSADDIGQGIYDTVNAYNGANRAGIAHGVVLQDVLEASDSITASLGNSEKKIGAAAVAARGLGLSLSEVDAIAGSLLNFEDSIAAELEAQLLTGKNINLSKARELALNNDLEGVAKELAKNGASAAEYANMNRLEQESLAKALGMSRDQLAKSVLTQEAMKNMTAEQIAKARGVTLEQSKAMDVQEKMQVGMQKLAEAFAPLLDVVVNLVDGLMFIVKPVAKVIAMVTGNPIGKYLILAVVAANFLGVAVSGVGRAFGSMYKLGAQAITGLIGLFKKGGLSSALGGLKNTLTGGFNRGATGMGASSPWSPGQQTPGGDKSKGMLDGIGKLPMNKILKGAGAILILSAAIFVAAKAFKEFEGVNFEQVMFGVGAIAALAGIAIVLGNATGPIIKGAFAVAILSASLIPLGYALKLAAPGIQAFGTVITAVFGGIATLITAVADGFVKILGAVTMDNIMPMLLLGPALFGIAAGLGALSLAGLLALPAIGGLVLLSKAAPGLVSLGMGGENKSAGEAKGKGEKSSLEEKLDNLITELSKNQVINVKVGEKVLMELYLNKASLYATSQG